MGTFQSNFYRICALAVFGSLFLPQVLVYAANDEVINLDTCNAGVNARLEKEADNFQKQLENFAELIDTPTEEIAIRGKMALVNFGSSLEQICVTNFLSGADGGAYTVPACKVPTTSSSTDAQRTDSVQGTVQKYLKGCTDSVTAIQDKYEFVFLGFIDQDKNNKKTYTYARALEGLGLALKDFNEQFSYMQGSLAQVILSMTYLVSGKNGGQ